MYITEVKEKVEQILEQRNGVEIYFVLKKNELILSILVDTFISKISFPMQPGPEIGSISGA